MPRVAYVVSIEVVPEAEAAWSAWYARVHAPAVAAEPGFLGATLYRDESPSADGWTRFVCRFDVDSRPALHDYLQGPASVHLRADHEARWGKVTRVARQILVEV